MTPAERDSVKKIEGYTQPVCPGCGNSMKLGLEFFDTKPRWMTKKYRYGAWYYCNRCGDWRTKASYGFSATTAAEDAYKTAVRRVEK